MTFNTVLRLRNKIDKLAIQISLDAKEVKDFDGYASEFLNKSSENLKNASCELDKILIQLGRNLKQ